MGLQLITKSAEVKLMQVVNDMRPGVAGWTGLYFRLSELLEEYKSEYQVKIAINLIHDLLKTYEGSIFLLIDNGIIVMCRGLEATIVEKLIFQLRYLYMDDPLAYTEMGQENTKFCTMYDLKRNWQDFHDVCTQRMAIYARKQPMAVQVNPEKFLPIEKFNEEGMIEPAIPKTPMLEKAGDKNVKADTGGLSAQKLAMIERDLNYIDLAKVIRRQPVCAILKDMNIRRVFDELYLHINHLRQVLKSEVDFLSNRWLFKYLTHILDQRMLEMIKEKPSRYLNSPISLNLNVETLLSTQFSEFDRLVPEAAKVSIVIEVPVVDVFADMTAFQLARTEVQKLGYRVCLDGLTVGSFMSINREKLGLDLVKVQWNADAEADLKSFENLAMAEAVHNAGGNRVILCRCDNRSAVEYGHSLGISLFQGRYIDNVLNPTSKQQN